MRAACWQEVAKNHLSCQSLVMKGMLGLLAGAVMLAASALPAQKLVGDWQGTLGAPPNALRLILRVAREDNGGLSALLVSVD